MPQYELSFRDYWRIIRKRKLIIIFTTLVVFSAVIIYFNLQPPIYEAFSTIRIEQRKTLVGALMEYITSSPGDVMVTEAKIIESRLIAEEVVRRLGLAKEEDDPEAFNNVVSNIQSSISTEGLEDTNLIRINALSRSPQMAVAVVNEAAEVYVEHDLERKIKQARQVREFVEGQLSSVEDKLRSSEEKLKKLKEEGKATGIAIPLENKLIDLRADLSEFLAKATEKHPQVGRLRQQIQDIEGQLKTLPADELEFARLNRDINVNEKLYTTLKGKFEEAQIAEAEKMGDVSIVDYAIEPTYPVKPNKKLGSMLGMIVGLVFGFVLSFVAEGLDTSIGNIEDVEGLLKVPVLGVIPHIRAEERGPVPWWRKGPFIPKPTALDEASIRLLVHNQPTSPIAEAYRTLRTNLKLKGIGRKSILVTSSGPREGKSTILVNLALTAAQMGNKILLVSSDLRRPVLYRTFGIKREPGLDEVLSSATHWEKVVKTLSDILIGDMGFDEAMKTPGLDNLNILTSGRLPLNPSELLGSKETLRLIQEFKNKYDVIFFDSPPVLLVTDAIILAPKVDGVIIIHELGRTAKAALLRVKNQLEDAGAKVLGVVLNHIRPETYQTYYPYYYRYKYYGEEERKRPKGIRKRKSAPV